MGPGEFADALSAMSAAGVATDGETGGNLFYESAATRIRAAGLAIDELKAENERLKLAQPMSIHELMKTQGLRSGVLIGLDAAKRRRAAAGQRKAGRR
jgi:hypothetical protein